jgi:molecular chaperone Hsp33
MEPKSDTLGHPDMTLTTQIAWDDTILPFQLDRSDIRGRVARLDQTLDRVLAQHDYPPEVEALVAEAALLTAMIGQTIKLRWKLSLQVRGDGPIRLIATDFFAPAEPDAPARMRAWASFDADRLTPGADPFAQVGKGYFAMLIDQGQGNTPYQGITPLAGGSLAACAEAYFAQSEQLPTRFEVSFGQSSEPKTRTTWRGGGVMLQHMPKASPLMEQDASGEEGLLAPVDLLDETEGENWARANILLDTADALELIGPRVAPTDLLLRLFHEEGPRVFDALPVQFGCTCSADRVRTSLSIYSARDIGHMTTEAGRVTADCQFCGAHYDFDPRTLGFEAEIPPEEGDGTPD